MHEMSLCEGLLQVIEEEASKQGFRRVLHVWLEIGELAAVEVDALRFCFDIVTRDTLAEEAELTILPVRAEAWCDHCGKTVTIRQRYDACPLCGNLPLQITSGDQMRIKELEVE